MLYILGHFYYTVKEMAARDNLLGPNEQIVLLAILRIGSDAYGMTIRREIAERTGREVSIGAVYTTLDRLEKKGYVRSCIGDPTSERGGRAKRFFRIQAKGRRALKESSDVLRSMTEDLDLGLEVK